MRTDVNERVSPGVTLVGLFHTPAMETRPTKRLPSMSLPVAVGAVYVIDEAVRVTIGASGSDLSVAISGLPDLITQDLLSRIPLGDARKRHEELRPQEGSPST